jgi:hypothetical protein
MYYNKVAGFQQQRATETSTGKWTRLSSPSRDESEIGLTSSADGWLAVSIRCNRLLIRV